MWWRALGVAVVLLCVGVAGGYAVADRSTETPVAVDGPAPVPASSPSVPVAPLPSYGPDPDTPPLRTADLTTAPVKLRVDAEGIGVKVSTPVDWRVVRVASTNQWNVADPDNPPNTYLLRITMWRTANVSIAAAMAQRVAALQDAEDDGGIQDFVVTEQSDDTVNATYVADGHLRLTTERWVTYDGTNAYASVSVTGRSVDQTGLSDLLVRTISSMRELPAKPVSTETP